MQRKGTFARASVLAFVLASAWPAAVSGQYMDVPRPAAYALQDVTVVGADGRRSEGVTVVVRGELIEALGRNVAVPADAKLLEGDSLVVYPGFIDGAGEAAYDIPRSEIERDEVEIWNAPRELRGFMPARRLVAYLTADGEGVADKRKEGIVAAAVHPTGAMMAGRGVLVMYRKDADTPEELVIRPELGPRFTLTGGQGVYPATLFGVMATFRQAFEDARYRQALEQAHQRDPRGLTTPAYDPDYAVLRSVLAGELPVYFEANDAVDILRVLGLADEYGFRPVITGGAEAWKVADELSRRNVPVLVSTDFEEPRRWDPEEDTAAALDAATLREKREIEDQYANAGRLAEAGVTFALTSGGTGEILEGVRKAVEHGLAESAALAALTGTPGELFGIPHVARIEAGLPATFVVSKGSIFREGGEVAYTFVEGHVEEGAQPRAEAGSAEDAAQFGGEWDMRLDAQGEVMDATLTIVQDGATFTGTMRMMGQRLDIRDGTINGNEISAVAIMRQGGETLEVEITGTIEGDTASGEADAGPLGISRWTATRKGPGGAR